MDNIDLLKEHIKLIIESINMFRTDKTNIPYYDGMLKRPEYHERAKGVTFDIEYMRPEKYLRKVAREIFKTSYEDAVTYMIEDELIDEYIEAAKGGDKFPMLILDYYRNSQEGRHRAYVAKQLGIKEVPVMIVKEVE